MYQRQNRNEVSVDLPRDYSGNAFSPFGGREPPLRNPRQAPPPEPKPEECPRVPECSDKPEPCHAEPMPLKLGGLSSLLGGNIGLEELLLLGVIFLIFADESHRDSELLICLLLILFI